MTEAKKHADDKQPQESSQDDKLPEADQPKQRKESVWLMTKEILFLFWDGFGFFGFDDNKLPRLKGQAPRWYDPFCNWRWMIGNIVAVGIVAYILITELGEFGHVKSQELGRAVEIKYDFAAQE